MKRKTQSWSSLPIDILHMIFQKLDCDDISRCAAVCVSWKSNITNLYHQLNSISSPFLLISNMGPFKDETGIHHYSHSSNKDSCVLFNPRTYQIHEIFLPELKGRCFSSSSNGWLLTVGFNTEENLYLLNPFTRSQIELPPPGSKFSEPQYLRVITSTNPLDLYCIVFATDGYKSAFCRPGHKTWKMIYGFYGFCDDAIFFDNEIYAVDGYGDIFRMSFSLSARAEKLPVQAVELGFCNYLVELEGELLLVLRFGYEKQDHPYSQTYTMSGNKTHRFKVYRLDWDVKQWTELKNIGNKAILLGKNSSIAVDAGDFGANCIYFIDDARGKRTIMSKLPEHETGVYNIETENIEWLYHSSTIWTGPLNWLTVVSEL